MKYVMFTNKLGIKVPVFCASQLNHCDMVAGKGWIATSAGEFDVKTQQCFGKSTSLGFGPAPDDANICFLVIANMEAMLIAGQDFDANLQLLKQRKQERRKLLKDKAPIS